jgi:glycosyltransferase involved in cell wall biosynthesis
MRILWITNTLFPQPSTALGIGAAVVGGWTQALGSLISKHKDVDLIVVSYAKVESLFCSAIDGVIYYVLPIPKDRGIPIAQTSDWEIILTQANPDIIHIHGTEYPRSLACINVNPDIPVIVSLQGIIGPYTRYLRADIPFITVIRNLSIRDIIRRDFPPFSKRSWVFRSRFEKILIKRSAVVLGRTDWDYAHAKNICTGAHYKLSNEVLRDDFYNGTKWNLKNCRRHSIFVSQGSIPIKGLHKLIEAISTLKVDYPDIKIRVSGSRLDLSKSRIYGRIFNSWFRNYLISLIRTNCLDDNLEFIGEISSSEMVSELQSAHLSISCSSIENSSNSIGEAQIIGTPVVVSHVGGSAQMVNFGKAGLLYRFTDTASLIDNICKIFESDDLATNLSIEGIRLAEKRHDRQNILEGLICNYRETISHP